MRTLVVDFETAWNSRLSLRKMSAPVYCRDPEFAILGLGREEETQGSASGSRWTMGTGTSPLDFFPDISPSEWAGLRIVAHNVLFDGWVLHGVLGFPLAGEYFCTQQASRWLWPHESASLAETVKRLWPNDEDLRKGDFVSSRREFSMQDMLADPAAARNLAEYCLQDSRLTLRLYKELYPRIPENERLVMDLSLRMQLQPTLALDKEAVERFLEDEMARNRTLIENSGVSSDVLRSQQKFAAHLEELGLQVPMKRSQQTGKSIPAFSVNDQGWQRLKQDHPEHDALWQGREVAKSRINETRAKAFLLHADPETSAFPVPLQCPGAHTLRWSGAQGVNLQNMPRSGELRQALVPLDPENVLYIVDWSQIEARSLAYLAQEKPLLEAYAAGEDIYCQFASRVFKRPITKADARERQIGKVTVLGAGFRLGWKGLSVALQAQGVKDLGQSEVENIVYVFRSLYPMIPRLWAAAGIALTAMTGGGFSYTFGPPRCILKTGKECLHVPGGTVLRYPKLHRGKDGDMFYMGRKNRRRVPVKMYDGKLTENFVQMFARNIMVDAMVRARQELPMLVPALTVHDEIVFTGPSGHLEELRALCEKPPEWCRGMPLAVEAHESGRYDK